MNDENNELNLENLENVSGGTRPHYPSGVNKPHPVGSNPILQNIGSILPVSNLNQAEKPFTICPKCHSEAVSFNREENICMCQDCGYIEDRSK